MRSCYRNMCERVNCASTQDFRRVRTKFSHDRGYTAASCGYTAKTFHFLCRGKRTERHFISMKPHYTTLRATFIPYFYDVRARKAVCVTSFDTCENKYPPKFIVDIQRDERISHVFREQNLPTCIEEAQLTLGVTNFQNIRHESSHWRRGFHNATSRLKFGVFHFLRNVKTPLLRREWRDTAAESRAERQSKKGP